MNPDKINELYFSDVDTPIVFDRRKFLKKLGGGIIVVFFLGDLSLLQGWSQNDINEMENFNAFLRVKEDGRVDCFTGKVELGQGVITSLAQVLAEELEISMNSVDMVMGDTDLCPYDAGTWGSLTTRFADPVLRAAAAEAREILLDLAAEQLGVAEETLEILDGTIFVKNTSRKITYAELAKGKKIVRSLKTKPEIKKSEDFKLVGKPVISIDAEAKVTGKAKYAGDIKIPGMVYASLVRPSVFGSKKLHVDGSGLAAFKGAELVEEGELIAVVHADPETANKAAKKVVVKWEVPEAKADSESIFKYFEENINESKVFEEDGSLVTGKESSKTILKASFKDGYKAHAPIETHTATCVFKEDKLIMWVSSQTPFGTREQLANALDMPIEKVHIKQIFVGGGFGGKIYNQQAIEAAKIAKLCGKPVQLVWSRREEFMYDRFRPAALVKATSGVDGNGRLNLWEFDIYCAGTRGTKLFYDVPNNRTRAFNKQGIHPLGTGAWRAPGNNTTTFARESHIDTTAHEVGIDPLEFRLNNLKDEEMIATLKLAAKTFGWERKKQNGHGYGIALGKDAGTSVATIAEVQVDSSTGIVQPIRIVCAQDMGQVVNPHGAKLQTEGGITMGLGYTLYEDVEFDGGKVNSRNFNNYEITRFSKTPEIECVFIDKMDAKPQGGGEPAIVSVGGAVANAIFDACGARVHRMPITPERILKAIKKG
jgi:isoquinoline 1-oxidoreductase